MSKLSILPSDRLPEGDSREALLAAGMKARVLRAELAASFLSCETIVRDMRAIQAALPRPAAKDHSND